jgi:hypothetical protein
MGYKVSGNPSFWKEMPHWYGLCSLAFHGWVIVGGIFLLAPVFGVLPQLLLANVLLLSLGPLALG